MPERQSPTSQLGERIAGLEATVAGLSEYTHQRWHEQAQTLQVLMLLPERITSEMAKMHKEFEGRIGLVSKEVERAIKDAVTGAVGPIASDVAVLKSKVEELEFLQREQAAQLSLWKWLVSKSPFAVVVAIISAVVAWANGKLHL